MQENSTDGYTYPVAGTRLLQVDIDPAAFWSTTGPRSSLSSSDAGADTVGADRAATQTRAAAAMSAGTETWLTGSGSRTLP